MNKLSTIIATIILTTPTIVSSEVIEYKKFKGWEIDVYTDENSRPYSCRGFMPYEGGTRFSIGFQRGSEGDAGLVVRLWNDSWKSIEQDKEYDITFEFPRREPWTLTADGMASTKDGFYGVKMFYALDDDSFKFIEDFRKTTSMRIYVEKNQIGYFSLKGTMGIMGLASECYQKHVKRRSNDPFNSSSSRNSNDPFDL